LFLLSEMHKSSGYILPLLAQVVIVRKVHFIQL
jgi:hypothetical protein